MSWRISKVERHNAHSRVEHTLYQTSMADSDTKHVDDLGDRERLLEFVDDYINDHQELYDKLEDE